MFISKKTKISIIFILAIIIGSVVIYNRVFSYNDTITHPALTDNIAKAHNANSEKKISEQEISWLKQGSVEEDEYHRWRYHFYEPQSGKGLGTWYSAKEWSQNQTAQTIQGLGNYTWQKAINSYVAGNKKKAFVALGHILHLIEDMAVPAHTRLDSHPNGDPYEGWVADNIGSAINFDMAPVSVNVLNAVFDDLANYSNKYFLSKDTIEIKQFITEEVINKKIFLITIDNFGNKYKLAEKVDISGRPFYILSDPVHSDYFSLLVPQAVSYGAGVVKLFFEEAEKQKQLEQQKSWWQKIQEKADSWFLFAPGSLYTGIMPQLAQSDLLPSAVESNIAQDNFSLSPSSVSAPVNAPLPLDKIVVAQDKNLAENNFSPNQPIEQIFPGGQEIPPKITEEKSLHQALPPIISPTSLSSPSFIPGMAGPPPSPSPEPPLSPSPSPPSDTTPPQISYVSVSAFRLTTDISWMSSEEGVFQIEYGTSTDYGLATATTSLFSLTINALNPNTNYHFRILAQDNLGNATSTANQAFTTTAQAENIVISEIQISGATANDEFVELYNPTDSDINLFGWRLARKTAFGAVTEDLLTSFPDKTIPAKGYFLIAHPSGYDGGVLADAIYSTVAFIADDNAVILYSDAGHTIVDLVGLGAATTSETATIENPIVHQSIERKAFAVSTAGDLVNGVHQWSGNGYDSDSNSQDFVLQDNPNPQNSLMLTEPRTSLPNLMITSSWPTWQKNLARTGLSAASSLATSTMTVKWTATTTAVHGFSSRPVIDDEGNIYIGRSDGLAKYSSAGNLLWLYASSTAYSAPLLTSEGAIFFRCAWALCAVGQDGQFKWKYALSGSAGQNAALAILSDGTIITQSNEKVYAINQDATLKWVFNPVHTLQSGVNFISAFVIDSSDNIYVAIEDYIYKISSAGNLVWKKTLGSDYFYSSLALGPDNTLYFSAAAWLPGPYGSFYGGFYALDTNDGSIKWADTFSFNNHTELAPIIDSAGNVYAIMSYGGARVSATKLQSYNATSTPSWKSVDLGASLAAPIITSDNKIYLADQNTLKIFDASNGNLDYSFGVGASFYSYFGAMGSDGTIYAAGNTSFGGTLFAIGK